MMREIEIPDCLTKPEAIACYKELMEQFCRRSDEFYNNTTEIEGVIGKSIGRFCLGGAMAYAFQMAMDIQNPREIREGTLEDIANLGIR